MQYNFERFNAVGGSFQPKISIRNNGTIGISQGALQRFELAGPNDWFVEMYYDKNACVIGMKPTLLQGPGTMKILRRIIRGRDGRETVNSVISAKSFLDYYAIPYAQTRNFLAKKDDESGMILIDLNDRKPGGEEESEQSEGRGATTS